MDKEKQEVDMYNENKNEQLGAVYDDIKAMNSGRIISDIYLNVSEHDRKVCFKI